MPQPFCFLLQIKDISLLQFKNYNHQSFSFNERITGICGRNGAGKTNLLDAIYYLCFTKSYFNKIENQNVLLGTSGFRLEGQFIRNGENLDLICILRETGKKELSVNEQAYNKLSHHIGQLPCVFIAPDDVQMITSGSEERRRYIDALISQLDAHYLQHLIDYNKVLQQRNGYLKMLAETRQYDASLLDVYDKQLAEHGRYIYESRRLHLENLIPSILEFYRQIAGEEEDVGLQYDSQLKNMSSEKLLQQFREKDRQLQRTNAGVHKDDLIMLLNNQQFKTIASQGQRKSLLFALKLAEFNMLKISKDFAPLLLLDDVFEKLDEQRMHNLLHWVCVQNDGQIFITDTHCERIQEHLNKLSVPFQSVQL